MQKRVLSSEAARTALVNGINVLADTIKATLGPKGRNVVIANEYMGPYITNDGATIAREFILEEPFENVGIELVKEVALKTNDMAGDGTTTATILAQKIINDGITYIDKNYSPMLIKEGIQEATNYAVTYLDTISKKIETSSQIRDVAYISSQEREIGEIIATAIDEIGNNVLISIEESKGKKTELEIVQGYKINEGYISPYMVNDRTKMEVDYKQPYFLITNEKIKDIKQISSILEAVIEVGGSLVIISDTIDEKVLSTLILNKLQNILDVVAIQAPSSNNQRSELLEDIAIVTGGKVMDPSIGSSIEMMTLQDLGRSAQVRVAKDATYIIGGCSNEKQFKQKLEQLKYAVEMTNIEFKKDQLSNQLANLSESAAIIKVGALSELEMKEKKMKIEDALCATRVAIKDGILAGGGIAYLNTAGYLETMIKGMDEERKIGFQIVINALKEPLYQLLVNAGIKNTQTILKQLNEENLYIGYNIRSSSFVDMFEAGIIDPAAVEIAALQSATSIASLILTTESVLVDATNESIIKKGLNDQLVQDSARGLF